jgi:hypothetical protein
MPIFEFKPDGISQLEKTTFSTAGIRERQDIQRLLLKHVEVVAPDTFVISDEFGEWKDSRHRIDILAIDKAANLVVIELKRTEDGGYMELQAIRYAAMVSSMTFEKAVEVHQKYLHKIGENERDAQDAILDFLEWDEANDDIFGQYVLIVLASAEFSKELTSSVLWLNQCGLDIRCVRLRPYNLDGRMLVDVQQIIPLPEAEEYQVQIREKTQRERSVRRTNMDFTRFDVSIGEEKHEAMWKRNAIFVVCRYLVDHGVSPDAIAKVLPWRTEARIWLAIDGTVSADEFNRLAAEKAARVGSTYSPGRWFNEDNELITLNGRTYAFSNQWGGENWHKAMAGLKDAFSQFNIDYAASAP